MHSSEHENNAFPLGIQELFSAAHLLAMGDTGMATYELSVRKLPSRRSYLVASGLYQTLEYLRTFRVTDEEIDILRAAAPGGCFPDHVYDWLSQVTFQGDVHAVPEGTVVFAGEPLLRLRASAPQAVLVGSGVLSAITGQTAIATKVSRLVHAARGKPVFEMGWRTSSHQGAAQVVSRSAVIGGALGSTNADASHRFGIPPFAMMPWSMMSGGDVKQRKKRVKAMAKGITFVLDDSAADGGLSTLLETGVPVTAVQVGNGDLLTATQRVRQQLDENGWNDTRIYVAGDLEEDFIDNLLENDAPIDGFGVGRQIAVVGDEPTLATEYNLVEREEAGQSIAVGCQAPGRMVYPGAKAVYRLRASGQFQGDTVQPLDASPPSGQRPLLVPVMQHGKATAPTPSLMECQVLCSSQLQLLPEDVTKLSGFSSYPVRFEFQSSEPEKAAPEVELSASALNPAVPDAKAEEEPGEVAVQDLISGLDDSADFGLVSSTLESLVASRLESDSEATVEGGTANGPGVSTSADQMSLSVPADNRFVVPEATPASDPEGPPSWAAAEQIPTNPGEPEEATQKADLVATPSMPAPGAVPNEVVSSAPVPEPSPPAEVPSEPAPTINVPTESVMPDSSSTSPAPSNEPSPLTEKTKTSTAAAPLNDAIARLKAIQKGEVTGTVVSTPTQEGPPAGESPPRDKGSETTKIGGDALTSAAARLKALKSGGSPPAAAGNASPSDPTEGSPSASSGGVPANAPGEIVIKDETMKEDGGAINSALDRLKALRNK